MNVIVSLEFELANYDVTIQNVIHYTTGTSSILKWIKVVTNKTYISKEKRKNLNVEHEMDVVVHCIDWYHKLTLFWSSIVWFGWVLWNINSCRLFNTKSFIYILNIGFVNTFVDSIFKWAWAHFFALQLNGFKYCYVKLTI